MMESLSHMGWLVLGAAIFWLGMTSGAICDRIRHGVRSSQTKQESQIREHAPRKLAKSATASRVSVQVEPGSTEIVPMLDDVRDALVQAGYDKAQASHAAAEARRQGAPAHLESWLRASLKLLAVKAAA